MKHGPIRLRKVDPRSTLVIDGQRVDDGGYELPEDPARDVAELRRMGFEAERRRESERTRMRRALTAVVRQIRKRKGRGFERTFFGRYTLEFHRISTNGGEKFRLELYRACRWDFIIEFWRSL